MALIGPMTGSLTRLEDNSLVWNAGEGTTVSIDVNNAITISGIQQVPISMFGAKSDGSDILATGGPAPSWATYSSDTYTLTRDVHFDNLTVNSGATLLCQGYMLYIAGTLVNSGTVGCLGNNGSGITGGAIFTNAGTFYATSTGGSNGATGTGIGGGNNSSTSTNSIGGRGGNGGSGGAGSGGTGGSVTAPAAATTSWKTLAFLLSQRTYNNVSALSINGGTGGAAGGIDGGGNSVSSGAGGGGGLNLFMLCNILDNSGTILSAGGNGANASAPSGGSAGGGGGGGAGSILIATNKVLNLGTITSVGGTGGLGAGGSGNAGANGSVGSVIILTGTL